MSTDTDKDKVTNKPCSEDSKESQDGPNQVVVLTHKLEQQKNEIQCLTTANRQLWTVNQTLRTQNQLMQTRLNIVLQPLVALNQQLMANGVGQTESSHVSSSSSSTMDLDWPQSVGSANLPAVVLRQIFTHVTDTQTLLACRLVCHNWKSIIDNTAALMRRLTFNITHPLVFMDLTNIVPGVRSVKFDYIRPFTDEQLEGMVRAIAPTLESVTFNFDRQWDPYRPSGPWRGQIRRLVSVVLSRCARLTELCLLGTSKEFIDRRNLHSLCSNITSVTFEVVHETDDDGTVYRELISSLHNISNLTLINSDPDPEDFDFVPVLSPVVMHMLKYPGVLKKFTYSAPDQCRHAFNLDAGTDGQNLWTKLYLIAGRHNVVINSDIIFNLENLLLFDESYPVNAKNCSTITKARNLTEIHIRVHEPQEPNPNFPNTSSVGHDVLSHLWRLTNLHIISLDVDCSRSGTLSCSEFGRPVSSVHRLRVDCSWGPVFDSTDIYSSISVHFPGVVELKLEETSIPEDLFESLARLEGLVKLKLKRLPTLTDKMFLSPQSSSIGVPPIASFANLKQLKIIDCSQLTDKCLFYGSWIISHLQSFTVANCSRITEAGLAGITHGRLNMNTTVEQDEYGGHIYTLSSTGF